MPLLSETVLRQKAQIQCGEQMTNLLNAELEIIPGASSLNWDPSFRRHVFEQQILVWREFDDIEVLVSPDGKIRSFKDANRLKPVEGAPIPRLTDEEIIQISSTTGLIGEWPELQSSRLGPERMLNVIILQDEDGFPARLSVSINPNLRQVAAFEVLPP